jgi:transcriptional regulator with XRE-family HTH domain
MTKELVVKTTKEIGCLIRESRKNSKLTQAEISGLLNCGNRFIVDAENGKETLQAQKLIDLLNLVGLEVVIRSKK